MKMQKKTFFIAVSLFCLSIPLQAIKRGYKIPDLRRQAQDDRQITKHLQRIHRNPTPRFESRHPSRWVYPSPSNSQKNLVLFFIAMIIGAEVATLNSKLPPRQSSETQQTNSKSIVYFKPYISGQESETFGFCETLQDDSKFCCEIQPKYVVECCVHPNTTDGFSRCVSFDPGGIIGDQSTSDDFNVTAAFQRMKLMCDKRESSFRISEETEIPKYLLTASHWNGSSEVFHVFGDTYIESINISRIFHDGSTQFCLVQQVAINKIDFPILFGVVEGLAQKLNFPQEEWIQSIMVPNDRICDPSLQEIAGAVTLFRQKCDIVNISISSSFLRFSDDKLAEIFAHELHHIRQGKRYCLGLFLQLSNLDNDLEAEADLASLLVTKTGCFIIRLLDDLNEHELPTITRKNAAEKLKERDTGDPDHPVEKFRVAFLVVMDEYYRRAQELLLGEND